MAANPKLWSVDNPAFPLKIVNIRDTVCLLVRGGRRFDFMKKQSFFVCEIPRLMRMRTKYFTHLLSSPFSNTTLEFFSMSDFAVHFVRFTSQ
jgi:hypothetical protein